MTRLVLVVLVAACNQVYGLDPTHLPDEIPDIGCPALGEPLVVGTKLHQVSIEPCFDYSTSAYADRSLGNCRVASGQYVFKLGEIGGRLEAVTFPPSPAFPSGRGSYARLSPDGNEVWVAIDDQASNMSAQSVYHRNGTKWTWQYDVPFLATRLTYVTAPTRTTERHILVDDEYEPETLVEFVERGEGTWVEHQRITAPSLGLVYFEYPSLSANGRRLVVRGNTATEFGWFYTDRAGIDDPFATARFVAGIPPEAASLQLSEDCTRLYFPALDAVFYLSQRD